MLFFQYINPPKVVISSDVRIILNPGKFIIHYSIDSQGITKAKVISGEQAIFPGNRPGM